MIEFPLLDIWSKFHRKVIVSYYTRRRARSKESGETEHSVHGSEAESPSIHQHVLHRSWPGRTWPQMSHVAGQCVLTGHGRLYNIYYTDVHATSPGHPLCRRLAAVQPSRWLAEVTKANHCACGSNTASICGLRCGCGSGQNPRTDVDEILEDPHLSGEHAPWVGHTTAVGQTESTEFMTSQSPGTKHYVPIHIPAWRTSIKQNKYLQHPIRMLL